MPDWIPHRSGAATKSCSCPSSCSMGSVHPKRRAYLLGPLVMGEYLLCKLYPRQILEHEDEHEKIHRFTRATFFDGCNLRPSALMCG